MEDDETSGIRQILIETGQPQSALEDERALGQREWTTDQMTDEFDVLEFAAPYVVVRRKSDGKLGSLEFTHRPRVYFGFREHAE